MAIPKEWFTVEQAAEYLSVSRRTVYNLTREGRLPAYTIGKERHRRFKRKDLDSVPCPGNRTEGEAAVLGFNSESDPVLAQLWDNDQDSAYDLA
jgi:excisionase family DNA binding protein